MKSADSVTAREYIRFVGLVCAGLGVIALGIIVFFHLFPSPVGNKPWDAILAISSVVLFWVALAGITFGVRHVITRIRKLKRERA